ncbi:BatD family protein [Taibaiella koreensis]|uniref:BatD family protein n=1 Tax=Taibaiella koreensis TaxID=1268548 RepID=UPI000E59CBAD|nr:BatD family protein [Taibaiella koreensis]
MIKKGFVWAMVMLVCSLPAMAQEMVFSAQANAQRVGTKDQFQVTYVLTNAQGASDFKPPTFPGCSIAGGPYQSNSSSTTIINGQMKQSTSVNIAYVLVANKTGVITIPPAKVTYNGKEVASNSVTLQVVAGTVAQQRQRMNQYDDDDPFAMRQFQQMLQQQMQQQRARRQQQVQQQNSNLEEMGEKNIGKNIFIKVEVDKTNPYVGEQITASYKLYTRLAMSVNLTQLPSLNGFWSQDFQIPNPPKPREEIVNGQRYQVFLLKKTALFPQQDGTLELDAAKAEGMVRVIQQVKGRNALADDPAFGSFFMDDPFFNDDMFSGYNYKDVPVKLSSQPVKVNVRSLPLANQPPSFTGAVGNFSVKAELDKNTLSTDDAATLTFSVSGSGNLKLIGNPKINFPAELGVYDPQVTDTITGRNPAITGSKIFVYGMNPQTPGDYVIPAIPFSYYDPASGTYKTVSTQAQRIHVTKGLHYTAAVADKKLPGDIHDIDKNALSQSNGSPLILKGWYWTLYPLGFALLMGLLVRRKRQDEYAGNEALFRNKKANKVAWKRLAAARKLLPQQQHKAFYEEVSKAIWLYLSDKLSIPLSHLSKDNVAMELEHKQVPLAQIDRVKRLVLECEMALYSPSGGQQQRQHTLDEAAGLIGELENVLKHKNSVLQHAG